MIENKIRELCQLAAERVGKNARVAPQLCFPHIYLTFNEVLTDTLPKTASIGDDAIEAAALKHVATSWGMLPVAAYRSGDYKQTEQFKRLKAFAMELLDSRAPAAQASATIQAAPVGWRDKLRWSKANPDMHGYIAFTPAQLEHFVSMLCTPAATIQEPVMVAGPVGESQYRADMPEPGPKEHFDDTAVQHFADAMKAKMAASRAKGRCGWIDCPPDELRRMMIGHIAKGDPVDVANFCMMLWSLGHSAAPMVADPAGVTVDVDKLIASGPMGIPAVATVKAVPSESMPVTQEPKYGICENRLFNRASGEFIPADEPVFIFRARDVHAANAIGWYAGDVRNPEHYGAVHARVKQFRVFADENPDRMKEPDTANFAAPLADKKDGAA